MFFKPRLAVIYVEYSPDKYKGAFAKVKSYLGDSLRGRTVYVIVNNRDEGNGSRIIDEGTYYIQGNNLEREFSGWQRGLEFLREQKIQFDVVLFVNEAFEAVQPSYLGSNNAGWITLKTYLLKSAFGAIDTLWEKTKIHGKSTRAWINTNCFFMPVSLLEKLGSLVSIDNGEMDTYIPKEFPGPLELFTDSSPVNPVYREHLISWLTEEWHGKFVLDERTWPIFRAKTKAILNEAVLSIRIRELGHFILPYSVPTFVFLKTRGLFRRIRKVIFGRTEESCREETLEGGERHKGIA